MIIKLNTKQKYNRAKNMHDTIRENGYKVTQFFTDQVWVDESGNLINVDRAPIRWDIVFGKKIDDAGENVL